MPGGSVWKHLNFWLLTFLCLDRIFIMADVDSRNFDPSLEFFTFRNEHMIVTVIIQMFLLFAGCVVVVGVLYVGILVVAIVIHHALFDRDPYKVPAFVRNSWQFTHEDSGQEEFFLEEASDSDVILTENEDLIHRGPTAQKKAQALDKFVNDLDNTRKMQQKFQN